MTGSKWSSLGERVRTGVLLATVSVFLILWGVWPLYVEMACMVTVGCAEFFDMVERKGLRPARRLGTLFTVLFLGAAAAVPAATLMHLYFAMFVVFMSVMVLRLGHRRSIMLDTAATWAGISYLGTYSFMLLLRQVPGRVDLWGGTIDKGAALLLMLVCICAATDMGAYFVGRKWGRTPLYRRVSPNKTWEGTVGGTTCAALLLAWVAQAHGLPVGAAVFLGIVVSACGQVGDLWESALKREVGLKDSGDLLGAHGGVLDRFDSLAFAAPVFFVGCQYLGWI